MTASRIIAAAVALTLVGGTYIREAPRQLNTEITACAAETYGYFEYNRYSDHIELTRYTGNEAEVTIPSEIDGLPVTALSGYSEYYSNGGNSGWHYFGVFTENKRSYHSENSTLVSVKIPDTVTSIGEKTFYWCSALSSVEISESITEIGEEAFSDCDSLTSISIPDSVETLGSSAFSGCDNLHTVRVGAATVGASAFSSNNKLTDITISDNVKSIGSCAFSGCTKLEKITFPDSVKDMGGAVFYGCSSLSEVTLSNEITSLSSNDRDGFFEGCTSLKSIVIPYYVTSIGENAFSNAPLESITIGARLSSLDNIPLDLSSLKEIKVADENRSYSSEDGI
ncbi:MAG: leucine-rich repeat domain-containing protein, partial [Lachnospiraceae bacterium]|nr:leucine-rich repeat domain-containing protein [Lachnospiraceae bacterium]